MLRLETCLAVEGMEREITIMFHPTVWTALGVVLLFSQCATRPVERRSAIIPSPIADLAESHGLVDVRRFLPDVSVDLRYGSSQNLANQPLYPANMPCMLRRSTALKLKRVQERLRKQGYALRIWDAWRPPEVQLSLMKKAGGTGMFLDPKLGWSKHCSGVAVDVTLIDLEGREQRLPTSHDEAGDRAYFQYSGDDPVIRHNLATLQGAMEAEGFSTIALEWWHFDDKEWFYNPPPAVFARQVGLELPVIR